MSDTEKPEPKEKSMLTMGKVYIFALEFGFVIALPLIGFVYLGKDLDNRWNTDFVSLIGIGTALMVSTFIIYRRIKTIQKNLKNS